MKQFKTESKKLLDLMINSIYTNQDIFLRELISNASDALDKLRFKQLTDDAARENSTSDKLAIRLAFDKQARTITVEDNGIGMSSAELEKNLGTIAHSDSRDFKQLEEVANSKDANIIGQFGVGFYSAFMVAQKVEVLSRAYGSSEAYRWESDGIEGYTISPAEKEHCGTVITLHLKDNTDDENFDRFLSEWDLTQLVHTYSNYVRYPITMMVTKSRELPKPDDAPDDYKPEYEQYQELDTLNSMVPIWKRKKSDVKPEEYNEFYKSTFHDFADPLRVASVHAEGAFTYDALLFIPGQAPFDLYSRDYQKGLALYSSNVLIMDKCADLLPDYYMFVRGIVDSADLTLNISRETLQRDAQLRAIAQKLEKKITSELEAMRDTDRVHYEEFFASFGRCLKFGIYSSYGAKAEMLSPLLMYYSCAQKKMLTLHEYVESMKENQKDIYYAFGESRERLENMPMVQSVCAKGYDVLLCTEDVDEFCFQMLHAFEEKSLVNVANAQIDIASDEEKAAAKKTSEDNSALLGALKEALSEQVSKVEIAPALKDVPAVLTTEGDVSLEMEKLLNRMPEGGGVKSQRVLQLNSKHHVFDALQQAQAAHDTEKVALYAKLLYNQALLVEGGTIENPREFAEQISSLM